MAYLNINGINIHYTDIGKGKETVVLLHGLGSCGDDWQPQQEAMRNHYRVISIDLRGHGLSDKPDTPYSFPLFADDVKKLTSSLGIEKFHLVGFSMGGMTAMQFSADHPNSLLSLTVINSGPGIPDHKLMLRWTFRLRMIVIRLLGMETLGHLIARKLFPNSTQNHLRDRYINRMRHNDKTGYLRSLQAFPGWNVTDKLPDFKMPVLVITADDDYTSVADKKAYQELIPDSQLVIIENSRHATPLDQPTATNDALLNFFRETAC